MKRIVGRSLALGVFLLAFVGEALGAEVIIDQMQPLLDQTRGGLAIGGVSEQKLAQTITVGSDGRLEGIFLPVACTSGALVEEIRTLNGDLPGDRVLSRRTVPAERLAPLASIFHYIALHGPLLFIQGDRFAQVVENPTGTCGMYAAPSGDSYSGGIGYFDARPNAPGWEPFFGPGSQLDCSFMMQVRLF